MSWFRTRWAAIPADIRVFAGLLAVLVPAKVAQTWGLRWMSVDGGYYTEVARHVRDGLGLTTHVSLNNFGYEHFPHPTSVYPAWPMLLGWVGRVVDLNDAAHWLPAVLYLVSVVAAFGFGRRWRPAPLLPEWNLPLHAGHVAAVLLAFNQPYIAFTSLPYTEGLSWACFFIFAWRLAARGSRRTLAWAVELGAWCALLFFCRSQFMVVGVAVLGALAVRTVVGPDRIPTARTLGVAALVAALPVAGWLHHLRSFLPDAGPLDLLRFDQNRANGTLSEFDVIVPTSGVVDLVVDRLSGLGTAFDPGNAASWHASFGVAHWALPIAALWALVAWVRVRTGPAAWLAALRRDDGVVRAVLLLVALGGFASVQLAHKHFFGEWYFHRRQGIAAYFAFLLPLLWLFARGGAAALVATSLVAGTVVLGAHEFAVGIRHSMKEGAAPDKYAEVVGWLKQHSSKERPITVTMPEGTVQRVAWRTGNVGYHWLGQEAPYSDLRKMVDELGVQYALLSGGRKRSWALYQEGAGRIEADFERLPDRPNGYTILRPRSAPLPPPASRKVLLVGVDGASWKVMGPMIERGELPTFARLFREGASQVEFDTIESTDSPVVWTTVATGRSPKDHGVVDYTEEVEGVGMVPITSNKRKVPAIWNIATKGGKSVGVVNWWASWPAEPVNGWLVSDHANPAAAGWMGGRYWNADAEALAAMQEDTWPKDLAAALRPLWIVPEAFPKDDFLRRSELNDAQWAQVEAAPYNERTAYSWLKTFYTLDEPHTRLAVERLQTDQPDLTMVYLRGPDPIQHYAWNLVEPWLYATPPAKLARDRGIVEGVYRYSDTMLAELIAAAGEDTTVLVNSDHGAEPCPGATKAKSTARPGCHERTAKGVFFATGPGIQAGARLKGASPYDIAPTIAWLLGLPVSKELPGRVLSEAFQWDYAGSLGRSDVDSWGPREAVAAPSTASPADAQMLEQLRGLGYIE